MSHQGGWNQQPAPATPTNGLAVGALIAGVIAFLTGWLFVGIVIGIAAIVLGLVAMKRPGGRGLAIGGIVTGALGVVLGLVVVAVVVLAADDVDDIADRFADLGECLEGAGDDQDEIDRCEEEFLGN